MQKINNILLLSILVFNIQSCAIAKWNTLIKDNDLEVSFTNSKKIGKRVQAKLEVNDLAYEYEIHLGYMGKQLHIIRYTIPTEKIKNKSRLESFREMEFLVTDTARNNPNYMGSEVNDYYDPTFFKGKYEVNKLKKIISPVFNKEYGMFHKIKDVLIANQIDFESVDSTTTIGWFKYEF